MSSKHPPVSEIFGQTVPPVAQEWTPQEVADLDARAEAAITREATRAMQVERFMLMPMAQKHRSTFIAVREVRDVSIYLQREYNALAKDLGTILENYAQRIVQLEARVDELEKRAEPEAVDASPSQTKAEEPQVERQLSLVFDDPEPSRG